MNETPSDASEFQSIYQMLERGLRSVGEARLFMSLLLEHLPELIAVIDTNGRVLFASKAHARLAEVSDHVEEIIRVDQLFPHDVQAAITALSPAAPLATESFDISLKHKDGSRHCYHFLKFHLQMYEQSVIFLLGLCTGERAVGEINLHSYKSMVNHLAFNDAVTGIANRNLFYDRLHKSLSLAKRNSGHFALMLIDLDKFSTLNAKFGRDVGDRFLQHVAQQLITAVRDTDTVARMSGDEFIVILDNIKKAKDIQSVAEKLLDSAARSLYVEGREISCTASMGISLFPKDGDTADELLRNADKAMYKAKAAGKNQHRFFIKAMTDSAVNYLLLENDLRKALEGNELQLFFQPQVFIADGGLCGVEALCRWQHKNRGLLSPAHFISLAEETGIIETLGGWVLNESCRIFKSWLDRGVDLGKLSVNVSARQFRNAGFQQSVLAILERTGLPHKRLELELTESSTMENAGHTLEVLNELHAAGVSIALDDFGTGYSSLSYLRRFPIGKLKIDKSFISNVDRDPRDAVTAKSIIDLAHNMSLHVIAEGVERQEQLDWLQGKGCEQVQGFYYAKPLAEKNFLKLIYDTEKAVLEGARVRLKCSR